MKFTDIALTDSLPLTCSRSGTCCHGNKVLLNPWELYRIASEKKMRIKEFRDKHTDDSGIQLRFNGEHQWKGKSACNQYKDGIGCTVHAGRPLACRLYPLGRKIQNNAVRYIHEGKQFPCLNDCPEVQDLPYMTVEDYLHGQETKLFEQAQDAYLELMQDIADLAFEFILETGLTSSEIKSTLIIWREMGNESTERLSQRLGTTWMDQVMTPAFAVNENYWDDPIAFIQKHGETLQVEIQEKFGQCSTQQEFQSASAQLMGISLQLARAIGMDPKALAEQWCDIANGYESTNQDVN